MQIDGQCHCGLVCYTAEVDPDQVSICHCTDCQALTGSAFRVTVMAAAEKLHQTGAAPALYVKHGANGRKRLQYFCAVCGAPLFTTGEGTEAAEWGIRWGSIAQRAALVPRRQIWCGSAQHWLGDIAALPGRVGD